MTVNGRVAVERGALFVVPDEEFSGPLERAHLEASCYPLPDGGYRTTIEPAFGTELDGQRPWDGKWLTYGSLRTEQNPNDSFEQVLGLQLACDGLRLTWVARRDNYLVTLDGKICWRYSLGIERAQRVASSSGE